METPDRYREAGKCYLFKKKKKIKESICGVKIASDLVRILQKDVYE